MKTSLRVLILATLTLIPWSTRGRAELREILVNQPVIFDQDYFPADWEGHVNLRGRYGWIYRIMPDGGVVIGVFADDHGVRKAVLLPSIPPALAKAVLSPSIEDDETDVGGPVVLDAPRALPPLPTVHEHRMIEVPPPLPFPNLPVLAPIPVPQYDVTKNEKDIDEPTFYDDVPGTIPPAKPRVSKPFHLPAPPPPGSTPPGRGEQNPPEPFLTAEGTTAPRDTDPAFDATGTTKTPGGGVSGPDDPIWPLDALGTTSFPKAHATIPLLVRDGKKRVVRKIPPCAFRMWENGKPAKVIKASHEPIPTQLGFIIDGSISMQEYASMLGHVTRLEVVKQVAEAITRSFLGGDNKDYFAFSGAFSDNQLKYDVHPSLDPVEALKPIQDLKAEGFTPLFDSMGKAMEAAHAAAKDPETRTILVVLTDGGNNSSHHYGPHTLEKLAETTDTVVYDVDVGGLMDHLDFIAPLKAPGELLIGRPDGALDALTSIFHGMKKLTHDTGGAYLHTGPKKEDIQRVANAIIAEIKSRASVTFETDGFPHNRSDYSIQVDRNAVKRALDDQKDMDESEFESYCPSEKTFEPCTECETRVLGSPVPEKKE